MYKNKFEHILAFVKAPLDHPLFFLRIFALVAREKRNQRGKREDVLANIIEEEYEELSRRLDRSLIQESCAVRNVLRTRAIARALIDEKGELDLKSLCRCIVLLKNHLYSMGPQRQFDSKRQEHILKVLQQLESQISLARLINKVTRPVMNPLGETFIRQTLQLQPGTIITDVHTRQAILAAWLCYLRQNVGSCFATAPAEIVHDEQPALFLQDLIDLISTGMLKRTFGGVEHAVPLSASWGSGDLKKPIVMRISSRGMNPEIWFSPGLMAAFETIGLLNRDDPLKEKIKQVEDWVHLFVQQIQTKTFFIFTAEQFIRTTLLQSLGITEKQIKEYENKSKAMIQSPLILQTISTSSKRLSEVSERCSHFFNLFERAKDVFKSFADNALLKAWEFTLASFAESKYEFTQWNLYASLGMQTNEPGGIGECIQRTIQQKLDQANQKIQESQYEYEMVYTQVKTLEGRMRQASTEKEIAWLRIEYQAKKNEFYFLEEMRNKAQDQASALVNLHEALYRIYLALFKDYFQEVYDADMQEVETDPFDDSPAGFRLLYKHGRSNTSQWTRIKNQQDFIDTLAAFFVATEPQVAHDLNDSNIEKDLSDVLTGIINHIKTKEFLETAFQRMAMIHQAPVIKDPLNHLDKIEKKPWSYTSGGKMDTLVSCYYRLDEKPNEIEKWIESEVELLVFIADAMKFIPHNLLTDYFNGKLHSMLMQSPTHAFLLKPMLSPFREMWMSEAYTYTFIRDHFILPSQLFLQQLLLNDEMVQYLLQLIYEKIPEQYLSRFKMMSSQLRGPLSPFFFHEFLVEKLQQDRHFYTEGRLVLPTEEIDALLYAHLPLFHVSELREKIEKILDLLPEISDKKEAILRLLEHFSLTKGIIPIMGAKQLTDICKALLCLIEMRTTTSNDYHLLVQSAAQTLGFCMPAPLIFADTNWVKEMFGFVVNPGTNKLDLWRLDDIGSQGRPMPSWKQWIDGKHPNARWGIYVKPYQYGQS